MKKLLLSPVFLLCCALFILHQLTVHILEIHVPIVDSYLDNLLAMPVILSLLLLERKYLFKWKDYNRLTLLEVVLATVLVSFVSEIIFPWVSRKFTGDWMDVVVFFAGAFIFYFTLNRTFDRGT